jgi:serine O-acetyltransferase
VSVPESWLHESLAFVHESVSSSPLRRHAGLFAPDQIDSPKLAEALSAAHPEFSADLDRWSMTLDDPGKLFEQLAFAPTLQATFFYRVCRALFLTGVKLLPDVIAVVSRQLTAIEIYYSADIGPGLKIIHGAGTVIGAQCTIGSHFTVYQNVTVGDKLGRHTGARPEIGERVIATTGAQVLGPVQVGSETIIGANSVVLESIPSRSIAAGIPAKVKVADLSDDQFAEFWASIKS